MFAKDYLKNQPRKAVARFRKNAILSSVSMLIGITSGWGQAVTWEKSAYFKMPKGAELSWPLMADEGSWQFATSREEGKLVNASRIDIDNPSDIALEDIFQKNQMAQGGSIPEKMYAFFPGKEPGVLSVFYQDVTRGKNRYRVWLQKYSMENGPAEKIQIGDTYVDGTVSLFFSLDSTRYLIQHQIFNKANESYVATFDFVDENYNIVSHGELSFRGIAANADILDLKISNSGKGYIWFKDNGSEGSTFVYELDFTGAEASVQQHDGESLFAEKEIYHGKCFTNDSTITFLGIEGSGKGASKGIWMYVQDFETGQEMASHKIDLNADIRELFMITEGSSQLKPSDMRVLDFVQHPDGSSHIICDIYYSRVFCSTDGNGRTSCVTIYYSRDIIVLYSNASGELEWFTSLPRYVSKQGLGQFIHNSDKNLYILYLDHYENSTIDDPQEFEKGDAIKNLTTWMATINAAGEVTKEPVIASGRDEKTMVHPTDIYPVPGENGTFLGVGTTYGFKGQQCIYTFKFPGGTY